MIKQLGKSITMVNAAAFIMVIFVGGVSIFLTKGILENAYKIERISEDIVSIDKIHADSYLLIRKIHHFLLEEDHISSEEALVLIGKLKEDIERYVKHEKEESYMSAHSELTYLEAMLEDVNHLTIAKNLLIGFNETGKYSSDTLIELEAYSYDIEETASLVNQIHLKQIQLLTERSLSNMWQIFILYLIFIAIGGVAIFCGHRALIKNVINPLKQLASATLEFARGTYEKRLQTESRTEIGQVYESFNLMAERIQEKDEKLRQFNEDLEQKVLERTKALQKTNEELKKTQDALVRSEKIAAVGQIAAGVTHEIKNPLSSLAVNTQKHLRDLSKAFGKDLSSFKSIFIISDEIDRINTILEEFVHYAKFPSPTFALDDINQVIKDVINLLTTQATQGGVTIKSSLNEHIPKLPVDPKQLKIVLINLVQNGIKAMEKGGTLEIKSDIINGMANIKVADEGMGIEEKNLEHIFTPFYSSRKDGLGLGLPIAQRIVESHGGEITCTSTVGKGTVFEISLPLEKRGANRE